MGIAGLVGRWLRQTSYEGVMTTKRPKFIRSVSIDMNSILHAVSANRDMSKLDEYFGDVTSMVMLYIQYLKPSDLIILAVDGVAPNGKVEQQRMRRYRSAMERDESAWDSNRITPGTEFMFQLSDHIERWLKINRVKIGTKTIYSSHMVPGEGEHKIMKLLRDEKFEGLDGIHVVAGTGQRPYPPLLEHVGPENVFST